MSASDELELFEAAEFADGEELSFEYCARTRPEEPVTFAEVAVCAMVS